MRLFIETQLRKILNDFKLEIDKLDSFCTLKEIRFDGSNVPNYSKPIVQQLYLLRYYPAYLVEYYCIYKMVLDSNFLTLPFNILSIGCGIDIDYHGLFFALKEREIDLTDNVKYTGLDRIQWEYFDNLGNDKYYFIEKDIKDMKELDEGNYNIILFAKSIGEFDSDTFRILKLIFENTKFKKDKICFISSLREKRLSSDINRCVELVNILMQNHKYNCDDSLRTYYHYDDEWLGKICPDFTYPDEIKKYIVSLLDKCPGFMDNDNNPHKDDCKWLNKYPILKAAYINFQIINLWR